MSEHTPGPWRVGIEGNNRVYAPDYMGQVSGLLAVVYGGPGNKHLIAAAPDLLAALEYVVSWENGPTWNAATARDLARAAIAKARGNTTHTEGEG